MLLLLMLFLLLLLASATFLSKIKKLRQLGLWPGSGEANSRLGSSVNK